MWDPKLAVGSISRETREVKCADGNSYTGRPVIIVLPLRHGSDGGECAERVVLPKARCARRNRRITSTTWSIDRGTCPSSLSSWRRGCHLRPSRPRRSKSTSSTRSDIVQVRAEVLVRLPGVAVGAVALPEARKHVPVADAAVGAHPLQHNLLVQDSPLPYLRNVWWHCARSARSFVPSSEDGTGRCNTRSLVMVQ